MKIKTITKHLLIGSIHYFVASPSGKTTRAIVLFPEAFGLTGHLKDVANRLAREGFDVYVPQLYFAQNKGSDFFIAYNDKAQREELLQKLRSEDFEAAFQGSSGYFSSYEKVMSMGFSIGGYFALMSASFLNSSKVVAFYPNPTLNNRSYPLKPLNQYPSPQSSLLIFGEEDFSLCPLERTLLVDSLAAKFVVYKGAQHGFFCNNRHVYNKQAASDAWEKILEFFKKDI